MRIAVVTLFPAWVAEAVKIGVVGRAIERGQVQVSTLSPRDFASDVHGTVDDRPYGGGPGMVLKCDTACAALRATRAQMPQGSRRIYLGAEGAPLTQRKASELARLPGMILLAGRYEGVDERVAEHLADDEISIGNYVLSGGELAAAVVIDTVSRLLPGVLGNETSATFDSFQETGHGEGLLDCPHWTRPAEFRGWKVPEVLLNGNHEEIRRFRRTAAREKTVRLRPDLLQ